MPRRPPAPTCSRASPATGMPVRALPRARARRARGGGLVRSARRSADRRDRLRRRRAAAVADPGDDAVRRRRRRRRSTRSRSPPRTAAAQAIVRHGIGGSIGIDFPTLAGKAERQAVAAAIDAALPQPFERTAVNGFGFLQIVRRRPRASLPELLRADPVARRGARAAPPDRAHPAAGAAPSTTPRPRVAAWLAARPDLDRRTRRAATGVARSRERDEPSATLPDLRQARRPGAQAVLQPRLPRPRPAAMARRRLSHSRRAGRPGKRAGQRQKPATKRPALSRRSPADARVAQLVEHATENRSVGGSTPSPGTILSVMENIVIAKSGPRSVRKADLASGAFPDGNRRHSVDRPFATASDDQRQAIFRTK